MSDRRAQVVVAAVAGAVFAAGLVLSGMTDPAKVLGFLDIAGDWDPRLAFVMIGAIGVHRLAYVVRGRRAAPLFDREFRVPTLRTVDRRLIGGAALFGAGWGLAGYCPGPAVVSLAGGGSALLFCAAMLAGMVLHRLANRSSPP